MNPHPVGDYGELGPVTYLQTLWREAAATWDRFWFSSRDPIVLGLIRILSGLMLIYTHAVWGLKLDAFLGSHPFIEAIPLQDVYDGSWATFWWLVPANSVAVVHYVCLAVLVLYTLGLWTRVTSILAVVITVSYANRLFFATFGLDQINAMLTFYLAISPCGAALSIDQYRRGVRSNGDRWTAAPSVGANIGIRLIQVHMCVIYLFAGLAKLEGLSWWEGYAMWQAFANYEYQTLDLTWLAPHDYVWNFITHATIVWEISYCSLIWFPLLRPLIVGMAVLTHVGIGLCLGMWTFGLIMLVGNGAFLSATLVRRMLNLPRTASC
ncbi:MAG: HTTM domain-containing protein [Planctomycetaceae bacterium]